MREQKHVRPIGPIPVLLMVLLIVAGGTRMGGANSQMAIPQALAVDQHEMGQARPPSVGSQILNPHSDLIFRATGATSCQDCHRIGKSDVLNPLTIENELVRNLREKARGVHGPGRFADCLRCHAGGSKGVEKY